MNSCRDVRVVESVLASVITTDVTFTAETTSGARLIVFHRNRVIVRSVLGNLSSHDWRIRRIIFIRTTHTSGFKTDR